MHVGPRSVDPLTMDAFSSPLDIFSGSPRALLSMPNLGSNSTKTRASRKTFSLFVVTLLVALSSTAIAQSNAADHITASSTSIGYSPLALASQTRTSVPSNAEPIIINDRHDLRLKARSLESQSSTKSAEDEATPKSKDSKSVSKAPSPATTSKTPSASTASASSTPLPQPFDNAPASDFQSEGADNSCPNFITNLFSNPTFKSCYPLSLMLQTSNSLFQAEKSLLGIVRVLDATCKADSSTCATFFDQAAKNLTSESNCKVEVDQNQTMVLQAYRGMVTYRTLYAATCLQDPKTNQYCFANAVTNLQTPSNVYLYFMPYGLPLPGGSSPSCGWCTQQTMSIYHAASADRSQFISGVYEDAARQINTLCGPSYVNGTLPAAISAASSLLLKYHATVLVAIATTAIAVFSCF